MTGDIRTVMWREWREYREQLLSRRGWLSVVILLLLIGVVTPSQMGLDWLRSSYILAYWPFLAMSMVSSLIADSIAGERERHTLETLLASRLPDKAILVGKVLATVVVGVGFAGLVLLVGWVTVNLSNRSTAPHWFAAWYLAAAVLFTSLTALLVAGIGVFISLRATSVRQAQQTFGIAMVVAIMGPVLVVQALPQSIREPGLDRLAALGHFRLVAVISTALGTLAGGILYAAVRRFKRGRLPLD